MHEDFMKDIYWAEKELTKSLPKMVSATSSPDLINALEEHLSVPKEQITRLEEVFEAFSKTPSGIKCEAIEGVIKEGESIVEDSYNQTLEEEKRSSGTAFFLCPYPM